MDKITTEYMRSIGISLDEEEDSEEIKELIKRAHNRLERLTEIHQKALGNHMLISRLLKNKNYKALERELK